MEDGVKEKRRKKTESLGSFDFHKAVWEPALTKDCLTEKQKARSCIEMYFKANLQYSVICYSFHFLSYSVNFAKFKIGEVYLENPLLSHFLLPIPKPCRAHFPGEWV